MIFSWASRNFFPQKMNEIRKELNPFEQAELIRLLNLIS